MLENYFSTVTPTFKFLVDFLRLKLNRESLLSILIYFIIFDKNFIYNEHTIKNHENVTSIFDSRKLTAKQKINYRLLKFLYT